MEQLHIVSEKKAAGFYAERNICCKTGKQNWAQNTAFGHTREHGGPSRVLAVHHHSLRAVTQVRFQPVDRGAGYPKRARHLMQEQFMADTREC